MDKRLINVLLRVYHSSENRFPSGRSLSVFCSEYNLGMKQGTFLIFTEHDKKEIGLILLGEMGIEPDRTTLASWKQLDRAKSLMLAHDEKLSGYPVSAGRLRLKTLPGWPLKVAGGCWNLPPRADLGLDSEAVLGNEIGHDALLVVENLQTFDDIHAVGMDVMNALAGRDPLVLYRGDAQGGVRADAVHTVIERTAMPVYAFVDFDPAGLIIATGLPRIDHILSPDLPELEVLIRAHGLTERYLEQVAAARGVLEHMGNDPRFGALWEVIKSAGKGLPQEFFHR